MNEALSIGGPWAPSLGGAAESSQGPHRRSRSSHSKSRTGCLTCRSRRVKCDETRPICTSCSFRKTECNYPSESDLIAVVNKAEASGPAPTNPATEDSAGDNTLSASPGARLSDPQVLESIQGLSMTKGSGNRKRNLGDQLESANESGLSILWANSESQIAAVGRISWGGLASFNLLSNFITRTHVTLSLLQVKQQVWKDAVIQLSSTSECLLHALLAVSAMHADYLQKVDPTDSAASQGQASPDSASSHLQASTLHHNLAVSLMRKEVASLTEENIQEVFATSTVLVAFSFATSRAGPRPEGYPLTWPDLEWLRLTRGVSSVTAQGWPALRMGPLRRLMDVRIIHEDWKLHLQGRVALHREPSLPIQLPQPTYMRLKELQPAELSNNLPETPANTESSSWGSGNLLYKQLTSFRFGADSAISELLNICNAEVESAEKVKESITTREGNASTSSGVNVDEHPRASDRAAIQGIQAACRVLKDLYIRILLMFQYSSFNPKMNRGLAFKNNDSCAQALQEIEEVGALSWPAMIPEDYVRELSQTLPNAGVLEGEGLKMQARLRCNRAKALVILAYYKVLLVLLESGFWWLHKVGRLGISDIAIEVKGSFEEVVAIYAKREIGNNSSIGDVDDEMRKVKSEADVWVRLLEWPLAFVIN